MPLLGEEPGKGFFMRIERVVQRMNLKKRARAARYLENQLERLRQSAHNLYKAGYVDAMMQSDRTKESA